MVLTCTPAYDGSICTHTHTHTHTHKTFQFNLSIVDDKQVSGELKKTLGGRLPERNNPVCIEIQMETVEVQRGYIGVEVVWGGGAMKLSRGWKRG